MVAAHLWIVDIDEPDVSGNPVEMLARMYRRRPCQKDQEAAATVLDVLKRPVLRQDSVPN